VRTNEARRGNDETRPGSDWKGVVSNIRHLIDKFQTVYREKVYSWRSTLSEIGNQNNRIVIWGAGSKGITFVNTLNISYKQIEYLVDVNPRKCGKFVPGTAQCIAGTDFLKEYRPEITIIMNPIYQSEIQAAISEFDIVTHFLLG
jgi:hypothetical protein